MSIVMAVSHSCNFFLLLFAPAPKLVFGRAVNKSRHNCLWICKAPLGKCYGPDRTTLFRHWRTGFRQNFLPWQIIELPCTSVGLTHHPDTRCIKRESTGTGLPWWKGRSLNLNGQPLSNATMSLGKNRLDNLSTRLHSLYQGLLGARSKHRFQT